MNPAWRRYSRFWGARVDVDVDEELQFHIAMLVRDYRARGMTEHDARLAATERLGDLRETREICLTIGHRRQRHMNRARIVDAFVQDCRYACRTLGRQRGWTTVALSTLALGIGASTAVFSVVNSLILHPLSYVGADRVAMVWMVDPKGGMMVSPGKPVIDLWKAKARSFDAVEEFSSGAVTLTGRGDATTLHEGQITSSFLSLAGVRPIAGRAFAPDEQEPGAAPVALISEGLWRTRFGGSESALQSRLMLDGKSYTIVGVLPSGLRLPMSGDHIDVWTPMGADTAQLFLGAPIVRLRPGIRASDALRELDSITARSGLGNRAAPTGFVAKLAKPGDLVGFKESLYLLSGAVALLLLVACANVAHLLLARGATRERELAIRTALGADRMRVARQLLTESLLLAAAGCLGGIALGYAGIRALLALRPSSLDTLSLTQFDSSALAAAVVTSLLTGTVFGLAAALHAVRRTSSDSLRATSLTGTATRGSHRLRSGLVVSEMALSAMLLVGAALLVRSVRNLQHVDVRFDPANLYTMHLEVPTNRYPTDGARQAFVTRVTDAVRALPTARAVALAMTTPPSAGYWVDKIETADGRGLSGFAAYDAITPEYFAAMGIPVRQGRTFDAASTKNNDVIINEGMARQLWPGQDPIGKRVRSVTTSPTPLWFTVVGVVANVPVHLTEDPAAPMIYMPIGAFGFVNQVEIVVRAIPGINPTKAMQQVVASLDANLPSPLVTSVAADLDESIATQRFTMKLLVVFAVLAVMLSAIGLYGVISYVVTQRTREIGIRVALGALPGQVARAIVARGMVLSLLGLGAGLVGAIWGSRLIKATLFGVSGTDAISYVAAGALLLAVSVVASIVPMRRAMRVDPVAAIRGE